MGSGSAQSPQKLGKLSPLETMTVASFWQGRNCSRMVLKIIWDENYAEESPASQKGLLLFTVILAESSFDFTWDLSQHGLLQVYENDAISNSGLLWLAPVFLNASSFPLVPDFCLHVNVWIDEGKMVCTLLWIGGFSSLILQDCIDERRKMACSLSLTERKSMLEYDDFFFFLRGANLVLLCSAKYPASSSSCMFQLAVVNCPRCFIRC